MSDRFTPKLTDEQVDLIYGELRGLDWLVVAKRLLETQRQLDSCRQKLREIAEHKYKDSFDVPFNFDLPVTFSKGVKAMSAIASSVDLGSDWKGLCEKAKEFLLPYAYTDYKTYCRCCGAGKGDPHNAGCVVGNWLKSYEEAAK